MKGAASLPDSSNPEGLDCSAPGSRRGVGTSLTWKPGVLSQYPASYMILDKSLLPAMVEHLQRCFPCPVLPSALFSQLQDAPHTEHPMTSLPSHQNPAWRPHPLHPQPFHCQEAPQIPPASA